MGRSLKSLPALLVPLLVEAIKFSKTLGPIQKDLDVLELFAGKMWISKSCDLAGLDTRAFDKIYTSSHEFLHKKGYRNAVHGTLRLRRAGCLWAALNCMPWIFICRNGSKRTQADPAGDIRVPRVHEGNRQAILLTQVLFVGMVA